MKKLLILLTLTLSLASVFAESKHTLMAKDFLSRVQSIDKSHCDIEPSLKEVCLKDLNNKLSQEIKKFNSDIVNDISISSRIEATNLFKYKKLLNKENISYTKGSPASDLKELYDSTMRERSCKIELRSYLDSVNVEYKAADECTTLKELKEDYLSSLPSEPQ